MKRKIKAIILVTSTIMTVGGLTLHSTVTNAKTIKHATPHSGKLIDADVKIISETLLALPSLQADKMYESTSKPSVLPEPKYEGEPYHVESSEPVQKEPIEEKPLVEEPIKKEPAEVEEEPVTEESNQEEPVEEVLSDEYIEINGTKFYAVTSRFEEDLALAQKYGSGLYALPHSCLFAFIKDGEIIFSLSTGYASINLEYKDMAIEFFSSKGFSAYTGLVENINHVLDTGEEVDIMLDEYIGYYIAMDEERISVSW